MKTLLSFCGLLFSLALFAQTDSLRKIEPDLETSFEKYELLIIAVLGLAILIGLRFWFKRTRKQ